MKFKTLFVLSFPFFLFSQMEPSGPVTTCEKDLLIAGITFGIVENYTDKGAYDNRYL